MKELAIIAGIAALTVAGCSGAEVDDEVAFMEGLRTVFPRDSDADLVDLAETACGLVETGIASGLSNSDAMDLVYSTFIDDGMPEAEALHATVSIIGGWCPMDIRE